MIRTICVLALLSALIGFAVGEQICINKVYGHMKNETAELYALVDASVEPEDKEKFKFSDDVRDRMERIYTYWIKKEHSLSIIIRHIDLSYISDAILYARNFVKNDNREETLNGLGRLAYLLDTYSELYSLSGANIF